jgi:hypothetical protein
VEAGLTGAPSAIGIGTGELNPARPDIRFTKEEQMSSSTPPAIVAPIVTEPDEEENATVDSADADRLASQGEDTSTVEQQDGENETNSADADYEAAMGDNPETD